ncbi:hypothetical protein A6P55_03270 [Pandoraea pnomenusa]|nr:hypothetical protein A6P55_03270 [Pandoraea pnomenusa]
MGREVSSVEAGVGERASTQPGQQNDEVPRLEASRLSVEVANETVGDPSCGQEQGVASGAPLLPNYLMKDIIRMTDERTRDELRQVSKQMSTFVDATANSVTIRNAAGLDLFSKRGYPEGLTVCLEGTFTDNDLDKLPDSLKSLDLSECNGWTDAACAKLQRLTKLERLIMSRRTEAEAVITSAGAKVLAKHPSLTWLDLSVNNIGDEGAQALAGSTTLTELNLTKNNIGAEGAKAFARNTTFTVLDLGVNRKPSLTWLDLSFNNIEDEGAQALAGSTTLTGLNLMNNNIGAEGAKAFARNTTLTMLGLGVNRIGDDGAKALAGNTTLTSLKLWFSSIGDEGAKALAENTTLTSLNLALNIIGDEGAKALAKNTTLTSLDLRMNSIGDDGQSALRQKSGRVISIDDQRMLWEG